jgi:hypothetical protein
MRLGALPQDLVDPRPPDACEPADLVPRESRIDRGAEELRDLPVRLVIRLLRGAQLLPMSAQLRPQLIGVCGHVRGRLSLTPGCNLITSSRKSAPGDARTSPGPAQEVETPMHPDRTDTTGCGAARSCERRAICFSGSNTIGREDPGLPRVIGLGAPLSVQIRVSACELPRLRAQVERLLDEARTSTSSAGIPPSAAPDSEVLAWEAMLDQLIDPAAQDEISVLWPSGLALSALREAAHDALDAIDVPGRGARELNCVRTVVREASAALDTLMAFIAVDGGGLQEIWL